jgi:capsular exopolysaccharide synthesis family protein
MPVQETVQETHRTVAEERAIQLINGVPKLERVGLDEPPREWLFDGADELFRGLYTRAGLGFTSEVLMVSSAVAGEGKSTVSVGLALTVAQDFPDRRIVLVETDVQHPAMANDFGVAPSPGLVDCILGSEPMELAFRPTYLDNLHLIPVGAPSNAPGRALRSSRMAGLVDALRQAYDLVILDAPSMLVNSDAIMLSDLADGTILVVRAGVTPSASVNKALEQSDESKLRGVVLNGSQSSLPGWLRRLCGY